MKHFTCIRDAHKVCNAIGSPIRLEILEQVLEHRRINLDTLAKNLHLTNGALTRHIQKLERAGLIHVSAATGLRGNPKLCSPGIDRILIDVSAEEEDDAHCFSIPIGGYTECQIVPYCGIIGPDGYVGERDDPRYFTYPKRLEAAALYFRSGKITYPLPLAAERGAHVRSVFISAELSAKSPSFHAGHRATVAFWLDGIKIGERELYGERNDRRGLLTPDWYDPALVQYGKPVQLEVNECGTFWDGIPLSDVGIGSFAHGMPSSFSISATGGVMLFGNRFGDYPDGIRYRILID